MLEPDARTANRALALLTTAYVLSFVDRTILVLMVGPIRADLHINDTEFSLLGGFAFGVLYALLGIPLGWWADHGNRSRIIALGIAFWSVMTMLCGLATNFLSLFAARVGVGAGEAALSPAAYSLIAETTPRERVGRAISIYATAIYLGTGLTFALGGWLVDRLTALPPRNLGAGWSLAGWQQVFLLVGLPGLVLAPLALKLLPQGRARTVSPSHALPPLMPWLRANRGFVLGHFAGFSMVTIVYNGFLTWEAEFLLRNFGLPKSVSGLMMGLVILVFGTSGMLIGGMIADLRRSRGDAADVLILAKQISLGLIPFVVVGPLLPSAWMVIAALAPLLLLTSAAFGLALTSLQLATPPQLRARVSAIYLLVITLVGIAPAGTIVAALSDYVLGGGGTRLGEAMALVGAIGAIASIPLLSLARRCMPGDEA
ncbi:MAG: MFS transporter [Sphingomonas sp.]